MSLGQRRSTLWLVLKRWAAALAWSFACWSGAPVSGAGGEIGWVEDFVDDPLQAGRFAVQPPQSASRFTYNSADQCLTVHYDSFLPTAWYLRPLDAVGGRVLGRYDDAEFTVTFRIRSTGFFADPDQFAQIAFGLLNAQTTGADRAGGSAGPFAFDCLSLDFFPNVSPLFGGPTLGPTIIHGDDGAGFFANIDFSFGPESTIDPANGDESPQLDVVYTACLRYLAATQTATCTIAQNGSLLAINADGAGGPGGLDQDPTTIQTIVLIDNAFAVDHFALMAWQDTFNPFSSSIIADVDILRISFFAPPVVPGDMNADGLVDGRDIDRFLQTLLTAGADPSLAARGDFNLDGQLTVEDVPGFLTALLGA